MRFLIASALFCPFLASATILSPTSGQAIFGNVPFLFNYQGANTGGSRSVSVTIGLGGPSDGAFIASLTPTNPDSSTYFTNLTFTETDLAEGASDLVVLEVSSTPDPFVSGGQTLRYNIVTQSVFSCELGVNGPAGCT